MTFIIILILFFPCSSSSWLSIQLFRTLKLLVFMSIYYISVCKTIVLCVHYVVAIHPSCLLNKLPTRFFLYVENKWSLLFLRSIFGCRQKGTIIVDMNPSKKFSSSFWVRKLLWRTQCDSYKLSYPPFREIRSGKKVELLPSPSCAEDFKDVVDLCLRFLQRPVFSLTKHLYVLSSFR